MVRSWRSTSSTSFLPTARSGDEGRPFRQPCLGRSIAQSNFSSTWQNSRKVRGKNLLRKGGQETAIPRPSREPQVASLYWPSRTRHACDCGEAQATQDRKISVVL